MRQLDRDSRHINTQLPANFPVLGTKPDKTGRKPTDADKIRTKNDVSGQRRDTTKTLPDKKRHTATFHAHEPTKTDASRHEGTFQDNLSLPPKRVSLLRGVMRLRAGDIDGMRKALEKIRASPGGGGAAPFAQIAGAVFDEIESLRAERFKLIDICEALGAEGYLPEGANPDSLGKALRRERKKRSLRQTLAEGVKKQAVGVSQGERPQNGARQKAAACNTPEYPPGGVIGPQLRPDNTFDIEPIDPDGLPEP
jgi:hypothetical protein